MDNIQQELFAPLLEKVQQAISSTQSEYQLLCFAESNLYYYSPESPKVTQWLTEKITGKTKSAPNIGETPQKIGFIDGKKMMQDIAKTRENLAQDYIEAAQKYYEKEENDPEKEALKRKSEELEREFAQRYEALETKLKQTIPALGKEGNYTFIISGSYSQYFPGAADLTEEVLENLR